MSRKFNCRMPSCCALVTQSTLLLLAHRCTRTVVGQVCVEVSPESQLQISWGMKTHLDVASRNSIGEFAVQERWTVEPYVESNDDDTIGLHHQGRGYLSCKQL